jgi:hypothetical protein
MPPSAMPGMPMAAACWPFMNICIGMPPFCIWLVGSLGPPPVVSTQWGYPAG